MFVIVWPLVAFNGTLMDENLQILEENSGMAGNQTSDQDYAYEAQPHSSTGTNIFV